LTKCGKCGGQLELLLASPAVKFKGTGWYVTDYPRRQSPAEKEKSAAETSGDKGGADKSASGKSKPADSAGKDTGPKSHPKK